MAGVRIICLILLCLSAVIIAETKREIPPSASVKYEHSTSPPKHASQVHSYPGNSHGHSRAARQVTSAPATTSPFVQSDINNKPVKQTTAPQNHSNSSVGGSGNGTQPVQPTRAPQNVSHPSSVEESGSGNNSEGNSTSTGILPDYVYKYRASQSQYRKLLTGLALYNFRMLSQNSTNFEWKDYVPSKNQIWKCQFGIRSDEVSYEEVDIDCRLITYFILSNNGSEPEPITRKEVDALDPKFNGDPIQIEPSMGCYIKWDSSLRSARVKDVDCGLLKIKEERSQAATKITTTFLLVVTSLVLLLLG